MSNVIDLATKSSAAHLYAKKRGRRGQSYPHPANDLSFMRRRKRGERGGGFVCWEPAPTGDYSLDCEVGRLMAEEYLAYIGRHPTNGNATLLTQIVRQMIERAQNGESWSGLHVGFLERVNTHAMAAARWQHRG